VQLVNGAPFDLNGAFFLFIPAQQGIPNGKYLHIEARLHQYSYCQQPEVCPSFTTII